MDPIIEVPWYNVLSNALQREFERVNETLNRDAQVELNITFTLPSGA